MNDKKIKVNVLSAGRFHLLDLSRELSNLGCDVKFYSFVSKNRCEDFGLNKNCCVSFFVILAPLVLLERKTKSNLVFQIRSIIQDYLTGIFMRKADIAIALSGRYIYAVKKAKKQGSIIIVERGSKHILEQKRILEEVRSENVRVPSPTDVKRELISYELADYIAVGAEHVKESFIKFGIGEEKLFLNPYGVDLSSFKFIENKNREYDLIMVGTWGYQKGCDILAKAIENSTLSFLHVGPIKDFAFPKCENMQHVDPVDQKKLIDYYSKAKVSILCSREEGLAMVQAQAIACGLPLICTKDTGGFDLKQIISYKEWITVLDELSEESIINAANESLAKLEAAGGNYDYLKDDKNKISWKEYGKRYYDFLMRINNG